MRGETILLGDHEDGEAEDDTDDGPGGDAVVEETQCPDETGVGGVPGEDLENLGRKVHQRRRDCGAEDNTSNITSILINILINIKAACVLVNLSALCVLSVHGQGTKLHVK